MTMQKLFLEQVGNITAVTEKKAAFRKLSFRKDWPDFRIENKKIYFTKRAGAGFNEKSNDAFVNKVKLFLKKKPWIFSLVYRLMNPSWSRQSAEKIIKKLGKGSIILNLGSGVTSIRPDVINIDFYPFHNVDFVADIVNLPFESNIADAVISECVLEHVPDPYTVVSEMHRVLKPGGIAYIVVPFVFSFHSSPHDFYRWTKPGLEKLFKGFKKVDSGIHFGPGNAVQWVLSEHLATLFSFGWSKLHQILFMILLAVFTPLGYLDFILNRFKTSENIASHLYFVGRKG